MKRRQEMTLQGRQNGTSSAKRYARGPSTAIGPAKRHILDPKSRSGNVRGDVPTAASSHSMATPRHLQLKSSGAISRKNIVTSLYPPVLPGQSLLNHDANLQPPYSASSLATSQPQSVQAGSLFSTTSQAGGLFGGGASTTKPTLTLGSTATQQPSGGLFGGGFAAAKPSGGSLFPPLGTPAAPGGGGLFGSLATPTPQPQQAGGGLFSGLGTKSTATAAPSLFPASTAGGPLSGGLFGGMNQSQQQEQQQQQQARPAAPSLFSLGASQQTAPHQQQQQIVPGVKIDWSNIKPTTRFSDLHEDIQKQICAIDDFIQTQIRFAAQINAAMPASGQMVESLPADVKYLEDREETVELAVDRDAREVNATKALTRQDADDAKLSFGAIENLKLPSQFHYQPGSTVPDGDNGVWAADMLAYFQTKVDALQTRVKGYTRDVDELEEHMATVEISAAEEIHRQARRRGNAGASAESAKREQMADLVGALRGVEDAIFRVAGRVGETREGILELQFPGGPRA